MQCTRCRSQIPAHSRFCLSCGQPVPASPPPPTSIPPAPAGYAAGFATAPAAVTSRRPIGPLVICIAVLLLAVATLGTFLTIRSLAAAGRAGAKSNASMVVASPKPSHAGDFVAAPPANLGVKPITPAPIPQPGAPSPVVINQPAQPQMPADILAYLRWLEQQSISRSQVESEGEAATPELLEKLLTGGLGMNVGEDDSNPVAENAKLFEAWSKKLTALHRNFTGLVGLGAFWRQLNAPGSPHVPQQCVLLHGMYTQALGLQVDATRQLAVDIGAKDMSGAQRQMAASNRAQELLRRADAEVGAVCAVYRVPQWFHISVTAGETPLPPVLPR